MASTHAGLKMSTQLRVPADFASIQAAVSAAQSGDTVKVAPGTYRERLNITTSGISLEAEGGAVVTIDDGLFTAADEVPGGGYLPGWILGYRVDAVGPPDQYTDHVTIKGFTFQGSGRTVGLVGLHAARDCRITGNTFTGTTSAINIHSNIARIEIDHNNMTGTANIRDATVEVSGVTTVFEGLSTDPALRRANLDISIHHNRISGFTRGLYLEGFEGGSIDHNDFDANIMGMQVRGGIRLTIENNDASDSGPDLLTTAGKTAVRAAGFALQNVTHTTVSKNHAERNGRGLMIRADSKDYQDRGYPPTSDVLVEKNHFTCSTAPDGDMVPAAPPPGVVYSDNHTGCDGN